VQTWYSHQGTVTCHSIKNGTSQIWKQTENKSSERPHMSAKHTVWIQSLYPDYLQNLMRTSLSRTHLWWNFHDNPITLSRYIINFRHNLHTLTVLISSNHQMIMLKVKVKVVPCSRSSTGLRVDHSLLAVSNANDKKIGLYSVTRYMLQKIILSSL